jgi:hypothetical protein
MIKEHSARVLPAKPRWWKRLRLAGALIRQRGGAPNWIDELYSVVSQLSDLNRGTEADFLAIGNKLAGFLSAARVISSEIHGVTDSLLGETGNNTCQALLSVLNAGRQMARHAAATNELTKARDSVGRIRAELRGLERLAPSFAVIATLAQIETAHLGSAGLNLGHLADEFRTAGESIRARVEQVLDGAALLEKRIETSLAEASELDQRSLKALPPLLAAAEEALAEFRARQQQGSVTATDLARQSDVFLKAIGDIVTSIQFHDITRQQVEHVMDALRGLGETSPANACPPALAAAVIELQLAHLSSAASAFAGAMKQMDQRLETIAGQINQMVAESGALLSTADNGEASFYLQMETCFRAIADAAIGYKALDQQKRATIDDLLHTLEGLDESVRDIDAIRLRLKWLALNAGINAVHIGFAGEPLEAVAAAMHRLLGECEASSDGAEMAIRSIAGTIRAELETVEAPFVVVGERLSDQLRTQIQELHTLDERTAARTRKITTIASGLSADVGVLRQTPSAERLFTSVTDHCSEVLYKIKERAAGEAGPIDHDALTEFKRRYTMRAEHDIHEATLSSVESAAAGGTIAAPPIPAESAENVELF